LIDVVTASLTYRPVEMVPTNFCLGIHFILAKDRSITHAMGQTLKVLRQLHKIAILLKKREGKSINLFYTSLEKAKRAQ